MFAWTESLSKAKAFFPADFRSLGSKFGSGFRVQSLGSRVWGLGLRLGARKLG